MKPIPLKELERFLVPSAEPPAPSESTDPKPSKIVDLTDQLTGTAIIITGSKKPDE